MNNHKCLFPLLLLLISSELFSQSIVLEKKILKPVNVSMLMTTIEGKNAVRVIKDSSIKKFDEPTFVKIANTNLTNGVIEVKVLSKLLPNAPDFARGFIGIAFRINDDNTKFESIYIRPTNGRANQQLRRNRSIQYFSYPEYPFERLRKEAAGEYESYADMGLNEWIKMKIVIKDSQAKLFLQYNQQPSLVVNDLKQGPKSTGAIGFFVDVGTEGYFSDLKIFKEK